MTAAHKIAGVVVALDHSPSEQVANDDTWHTSVAIFSEGNEHWEFSKELATKLGMKDARLRKWSGGRGSQSYREKFPKELFASIVDNPIHIRAISAQGQTIWRLWEAFLGRLQLQDLAHESTNRKNNYRFGPFQKITPDGIRSEQFFDIHVKQARYLVFLSWWLTEVHSEMLALEKQDNPALEWLDWFVMPNAFPGGIDGNMARLFHVIMSVATSRNLIVGNLHISTLLDSRLDAGSALADNVAGYLNQKARNGDRDLPTPCLTGKGSSFLWSVIEASAQNTVPDTCVQ
jgi:hypothetical protein